MSIHLGPKIRKVDYDTHLVDWGNVKFSASLNQMERLAEDLKIYVERKMRDYLLSDGNL